MSTEPKSQDGATAVEYALLIALIAAVIMSVVALLGLTTDAAFSRMCEPIAFNC